MIVVAIDTGGTKIAGAAVDEDGNILHQLSYPNSGRTGPFILDTYTRIVDEMQKRFPLCAIGIGAGGRIDPTEGTVLFSTDIYKEYVGLHIGRIMSRRCGLPVAVDNDCRVAVYGERWKGAAAGFDDIFGVILGTGVGGGYILEGRPVFGAGKGAGEVGHFILHPDGRRCACGQRGCVEQYLSGTSLWQSYNRRTGGETLSSGYAFFQRLQDDDKAAEEIMDAFVADLALCAVSLSNLLSPQGILFGGGLIDTADRWWSRFESAYGELGNKHCRSTVLLRAATGNNAALLGAAWLAFTRLGKSV